MSKQAREKYDGLSEEEIEKKENTEEINVTQCLKKKKIKEMNRKETDIAKCLKNKKIRKENTQEIAITP